MKNKTFKNISKILSIILSAALVFVLSCSFIYIVKEANHSCDGDNCPICLNIKHCEENIRTKTGGSVNISQLVITVLAALFCLSLAEYDISPNTLIIQKVRFND